MPRTGRPRQKDPRALVTVRLPHDLAAAVVAEVDVWRATETRPAGPDTRRWDRGDVVAEALRRFFQLKRRFPKDRATREER